VEERNQVNAIERHSVERDDGEMRQVLIVEKLRKAAFQLRSPEIERIVAHRQRSARALHEGQVPGRIIDARSGPQLRRQHYDVERCRDQQYKREYGRSPTIVSPSAHREVRITPS